MKNKAIHRFYEPLVLLKSLNDELTETAGPSSPGETLQPQDERQILQAFVYKLAHVCDNIKGKEGRSVSSCAVLCDEEQDGAVVYLLASNRRGPEELEALAEFVYQLIRMVSEDADKPAGDKGFRHILNFNKPRIEYYIKQLRAHSQTCLEQCDDETSEESECIWPARRKTPLLNMTV